MPWFVPLPNPVEAHQLTSATCSEIVGWIERHAWHAWPTFETLDEDNDRWTGITYSTTTPDDDMGLQWHAAPGDWIVKNDLGLGRRRWFPTFETHTETDFANRYTERAPQ